MTGNYIAKFLYQATLGHETIERFRHVITINRHLGVQLVQVVNSSICDIV